MTETTDTERLAIIKKRIDIAYHRAKWVHERTSYETSADMIWLVAQLESALARIKGLEQAVVELNNFDAPLELQTERQKVSKLTTENSILKEEIAEFKNDEVMMCPKCAFDWSTTIKPDGMLHCNNCQHEWHKEPI